MLVLLAFLSIVASFRRVSLPRLFFRSVVSLNDYTECQPGEFDKLVLQSKTPVIVDFFAKWCPPCKVRAINIALYTVHENSLTSAAFFNFSI